MSTSKTEQDVAASPSGDEAWSALVDGELSDQALQQLLSADSGANDVIDRWNRYHVIGDVLRGSAPPLASRSSTVFLSGLRERLHQETPPWQQPLAARVPDTLVAATPVVVAAPSSDSANEGLFRWKLVAGFASLTAVVAVSWSVLGSLGAPVGGPQLAQATPPAPAVAVAEEASSPSLVVVQTGQGALIRDPQLQALMAEHRQHGGMSALQMPAGFLRNATFDAPSR